jgi:eukaryotic-like serine/threonine-protein kinase
MCGIQSSPSVAEGVVYFGSRDAHLYAVDAATGKQIWAYSTEPTWVVDAPAVAGGKVCVGTSDSGRFIILEAATGKLVSNFDAGMFVFSSPAVSGTVVCFGCFNGRLYALDTAAGKKLWEFRTEASRVDPHHVLTEDGHLNLKGFEDTVKLPPYEGMVVFIERIFSAGSILSSPAVDRGVIYFGDTRGMLYAIE